MNSSRCFWNPKSIVSWKVPFALITKHPRTALFLSALCDHHTGNLFSLWHCLPNNTKCYLFTTGLLLASVHHAGSTASFREKFRTDKYRVKPLPSKNNGSCWVKKYFARSTWMKTALLQSSFCRNFRSQQQVCLTLKRGNKYLENFISL